MSGETDIKVGGIDSPWRVTEEVLREPGAPSWDIRYRMRLYRGDTEVHRVEYELLGEVDGAKRALLRAVGIFEGERIRTLAVIETLREAGVPEEVMSLIAMKGMENG